MNQHNKVNEIVLDLKKYYREYWYNKNSCFPNFFNSEIVKENNKKYKMKSEKTTDDFIEKMFQTIKEFPKEKNNRKIWLNKLSSNLDGFLDESEVSQKEGKIIRNMGLLQISFEFYKKAKEFDKNISFEDIGQAMRNVWICNMLQLLLEKEVKLTNSIYGYSMLYPYTDNYLDNTLVKKADKIKFNERFELRLKGEKLKSINEGEDKIYDLVNCIEKDYSRIKDSEIYDSLLAIQYAQNSSLNCQDKVTCPYENDILGVSIEKGGTSVLVDGYLAKKDLNIEELNFLFGYGVFLQIGDDLQDIQEDYKNKHMTILTQIYNEYTLDNLTNKLMNFALELFYGPQNFNRDVVNIIAKNSVLLIFFAIAKNKKNYSPEYLRKIENYFPYRISYMNKLYGKIEKKIKILKSSYGANEYKEKIDETIKYVIENM